VPKTCEELSLACGAAPDGCGGTVNCTNCPPGGCSEVELGSTLPVSVEGSTREVDGALKRFAASTCQPGALLGDVGAEKIYAWTAPKAGEYVFDSAGSAADTLLYLRRGTCGGEEFACDNDAFGIGGASERVVALAAGERVVIFVDTAALDRQGPFRLHISRRAATEAASCSDGADADADLKVDCADPDCSAAPTCRGAEVCTQAPVPALPFQAMGTTLNAGDDTRGSCGGNPGSEDYAYRFTAPKAGSYALTARIREDMSPVLYVLDGCGGTELACSADDPFDADYASLKLELAQGQTAVVVVDSFETSGTYDLYIAEWVPSEAGRCEDGADNDADGLPDVVDPECAPPESVIPTPRRASQRQRR